MSERIMVSEVFGPVIQGEGPQAGLPTIFVRTGGCDYRCSWCDTMYAVDAEAHQGTWQRLLPLEIVKAVRDLAGSHRYLVTLSGGNPAIWAGLGEAVQLLQQAGHQVAIETQGSVLAPWAARLNAIVLSPKPPSSGMAANTAELRAWSNVAAAGRIPCALKIVVADEADLLFAGDMFDQLPQLPRYVQPCNVKLEPGRYAEAHREYARLEDLLARQMRLEDMVLAQGWTDVRVLPQLHVLTHGGGRGV